VAEELAAAGIAVHLAEPADTAFVRGRKRHAKTERTDARHLRQLLAEGRIPECWFPPARVLECRALLETYHDLRREHTAWVQRVHAVFFHQRAPHLGKGALRAQNLDDVKAAAAAHLSPVGHLPVRLGGNHRATEAGRGDASARTAHVKPEHAACAARPWPSVETPTVRTDRRNCAHRPS
jgi:transposase